MVATEVRTYREEIEAIVADLKTRSIGHDNGAAGEINQHFEEFSQFLEQRAVGSSMLMARYSNDLEKNRRDWRVFVTEAIVRRMKVSHYQIDYSRTNGDKLVRIGKTNIPGLSIYYSESIINGDLTVSLEFAGAAK